MVVTNPSVVCWINDPTGCFWRARSFENKHEEERVVNWKLLPAGIGKQWVGFAARRSGACGLLKAKMVLACLFDPWLGSTAAAKSALLFCLYPNYGILVIQTPL